MQEFCRAKYKCKKESVTSYSSFTLEKLEREIRVTSNTFLLTFVYIYIYIYLFDNYSTRARWI